MKVRLTGARLKRAEPARRASSPSSARQAASPRILMYSHDSWGLGHLRRSLTIASALTRAYPDAGILIVTGSPCATHFSHPPGVSIVKLPSVTKDESGKYQPRSFNGDLEAVLRLRGAILHEAFRSFAPHLLIIDHQVIGLHGEALPVLSEASQQGVKIILGLRDIIDSPAAVDEQLGTGHCRWALEEAYDRICVYGDAEVYDPRREYRTLAAVADRVELTGYIVRPRGEARSLPNATPPSGVLVTMGGGQDGVERVRAYLDCLALGPVPWKSTIVTGPLMTADEVRRVKRKAQALGSTRVYRFHSDMHRLLGQAELVVSMAGYNSATEILQSGRPVIFMPRAFPRREQVIRARQLARLGVAKVLLEPRAATLRQLIKDTLPEELFPISLPNLSGTDRMCEIVGELLGISSSVELDDGRSTRWQHALPTC